MGVSRLKTWIVETLTASDLNAEFNNILNNGEDLAWPATKAKDMDAQSLVLDGDQDTHITADTDDRIDFALGGFDGVRFDGTTASSVNGFDLATQSTGVAPEIKSRGEANIGIEFHDSNGNEALILGATASAVNEITITNAATSNPPTIGSTGESDIGWKLLDSNGNEVIVGIATASAVNELEVTNSASGNAILIRPSGETNTAFNIQGAGTGQVQLGDANLKFPDSDGSANHVLITDGSAALSFATPALPRSYLAGLNLSNDAGDTAFDINVLPGEARNATDDGNLVLASEQTKQINASWSTGNDAGGLSSTLTLAEDTYHVFLILVSGTVEVGFDTSIVAANLITDHSATKYRRIGSVTTGSTPFNIVQFTQRGNEFLLDVPLATYGATNPGTSAVTVTMTNIPTDIQVGALIGFQVEDTSPSAGTRGWMSSLDQTDTAPSTFGDVLLIVTNAGTDSAYKEVRTDTSAQVRFRLTNSDAGVSARMTIHGWIDTRGRDD